MYARRRSHINTAHNLYELRKAGDGADRWKLVYARLFMCAFVISCTKLSVYVFTQCVCAHFSQLINNP